MSRSTTLTLIVTLLLASAQLQYAQDAPGLRAGNTEVGGFVGSSYGLDNWRVMGGGNVVYALTRYVMPYGEYSYFPGITRETTISLGGFNTARYRFNVPISDFHAGLHIRFPIGRSRVVPYIVGGLGGLHMSGYQANVLTSTGTIPINYSSETRFAVNGGGGLRFYTTERLGFRVEAKIYKPTGDPPYDGTFGKVEGGFFFNLR